MAITISPPKQEFLSFAAIRRLMNLSRERMGRLLDVSAKTVERWEARNELPRNRLLRYRLAQIQEIAQLGLMVYTREGFDLFLTTPMGVFEGHTALQFIEIGRGDEVILRARRGPRGYGILGVVRCLAATVVRLRLSAHRRRCHLRHSRFPLRRAEQRESLERPR